MQNLSHLTGFVWPVFGILVLLIATFAVQLTKFSDHPNPRRLRASLATPLFLGAASFLVGVTGAGIETYRTLILMVAHPEKAPTLFARGFLGITSTFAIALLVSLAAGVAWFVLAGRVARFEDDATAKYQEVA